LSIQHVRAILVFLVLSVGGGGWAESVDSAPGTTPAPPLSGPDGTEGDVPGKEEPSADAANGSPVAVIKQLNVSLQEVLREAERLGYQGRFERLSPILDAAFDFNYMAEKTVGRHWSGLSPDEQRRWVDLFADLSKATYAGRFDRYTGQTFEFVDEQPGANDSVTVRSKVVSPGEEDVDLSYRLSNTPAGWKVIDVYFKGTVSEVAMRRADYSSVLKNDGFEALVARVNERIAQLRAGGGGEDF
jgi:phospholipid transport system substrate-binding protein